MSRPHKASAKVSRDLIKDVFQCGVGLIYGGSAVVIGWIGFDETFRLVLMSIGFSRPFIEMYINVSNAMRKKIPKS